VVLEALGTVWVVVFIACIITTTYDEHQDMAARFRSVVNEKNGLKSGLETRDSYIRLLEDGMRRLGGQLEYVKAHPARSRSPQPSDEGGTDRKEDAERQRRKAIRDQLAKFINEGLAIQQQCFGQTLTDNDVKVTADEWAENVSKYLYQIEVSYSARFKASSGLTYTGGQPSQTKRDEWNFVNLRIQTLTALLQELKD
jgi:hypothetical protein